MVLGVTAGSAYAQTDDLDDILEDYCVMSLQEQGVIISDFELEDYREKLTTICEIDGEDDRENALEEFIDAITFETEDETEDDKDYVKDYDDVLEDKLDRWCEMTDAEKRKVIAEHDKSEDKVAELDRY